MPELLVNDWSGRLVNDLPVTAGAGDTFTVSPAAPDSAVGGSVRARIGTEIVTVTITAGGTWTIVAREAEDADRYPKRAWAAGTSVDLVLTAGGLSALVGAALPDDVAYLGQEQTFEQPQTFAGGLSAPVTTGDGFSDIERFGAGAAPNLTNGSGGVFVGNGAGASARQAQNTLIGAGADTSSSTGDFGNTAVGHDANASNIFSTAIGDGATATISGVAVGAQATATVRGFAMGYQATALNGGIALGATATGRGGGTMAFCPNRFNEVLNCDIYFDSYTAEGVYRPIAATTINWTDSADATRTGFRADGVYYQDSLQLGVSIQAAAAGVMLGFFGQTPVARPSLTYSRAGESTATAQLRAALAALGLVADNTTA